MLTIRVDSAAVQHARELGLSLSIVLGNEVTLLGAWRLDKLVAEVRVEHTTLEAFGVEISNGLLSLAERIGVGA